MVPAHRELDLVELVPFGHGRALSAEEARPLALERNGAVGVDPHPARFVPGDRAEKCLASQVMVRRIAVFRRIPRQTSHELPSGHSTRSACPVAWMDSV